ncbi:hypothetical protein R3P38DRAFT_2551269 [Favolaschia claudopus]|uniref:Uncharacterized protein n=1 Tax=Favolaschia claudopus TaxID=2862362 RepID=A0AAW0AHY6_9AGAR
MDQLVSRNIAHPPFLRSVFSTAVLEFGSARTSGRKNPDAAIETLEAITPLGVWDRIKGGQLVLPTQGLIIETRPGQTYLIASATTPYYFTAVQPGEWQFLFRQYCSDGIFRWLSKGGLTDAQFSMESTKAQRDAWVEQRRVFGRESIKFFSKRRDIFTL